MRRGMRTTTRRRLIPARAQNNVIIIYEAAQTEHNRQTRDRVERQTDATGVARAGECTRDETSSGERKRRRGESLGKPATKCDDAVRKADKSADLVGISYRSIL